jgi:WXXGXW repeat (2 copies)
MSIYNVTRAALIAALFAAVPMAASAQLYVGVGVNIAPPAIPLYAQPPCPAPNYIWEPGYWAWGAGGYYWVPGTWVLAPSVGLLWTPGYWGWGTGAYYWHPGYWGRTVGFYGGINYGYGFFGVGYVGGGWYGGTFRYNTAITNVNRTVIHNTYVNKTVVNKNYYTNSRVGYNGGHGGVNAHPTQGQVDARTHGQAPTSEQNYHEQMSGQDRNHLSTVNHGQPTTGAVSHPYSASNRPAHYAPVTDSDRQAARAHESGAHGNRPPR